MAKTFGVVRVIVFRGTNQNALPPHSNNSLQIAFADSRPRAPPGHLADAKCVAEFVIG
jgi:hypothetical protein